LEFQGVAWVDPRKIALLHALQKVAGKSSAIKAQIHTMKASHPTVGAREEMMARTDAVGATSTTGTTASGTGVGVWIFRILVVLGAAFMLYSWFQPWWSTDIAIIKGEQDMVLHPWGVDAASQVRINIDESLFQMPFPQAFAVFMWVYLAVCMLALAASLFVTRRFRVGPINISLSMLLVLFVGLSYMVAAGLAFGIGELKASASGINFLGKGTYKEPGSGAPIKMVSQLMLGYWLALGAGGFLTLVGLVRPLFVRRPKV
jgi:hypothetical protein